MFLLSAELFTRMLWGWMRENKNAERERERITEKKSDKKHNTGGTDGTPRNKIIYFKSISLSHGGGCR